MVMLHLKYAYEEAQHLAEGNQRFPLELIFTFAGHLHTHAKPRPAGPCAYPMCSTINYQVLSSQLNR